MNTTAWIQILCVLFSISGIIYESGINGTDSKVHETTGLDLELAEGNQIDDYFEKIDEYISQNEYDKALQLAEEAELVARSAGSRDGLARSALYQGDILLTQGRYQGSIDILSTAYGEYKKTDHGLRIGNLLATAYRFNNELNRSLSLYLEVLDRVRAEQDPVLEAGVEQNLAVVYDMLGDTDKAVERYFNSLEIGRERADTTLQIIVTNNIGDLYRQEGEIDLAEQYLYESLELAKHVQSYEDMKRAYMNLGVVYREKGNHEQALKYYEKSLEYANEIGTITGPIQILYNIGNIHLDREMYELALESYSESLSQSEDIHLGQGIYYNNLGLGDVYYLTGEYNLAINRYDRSLEIAQQSDSKRLEMEVLNRLWTVNEDIGNYEDAFANLKRQKSISDSLQSSDREEALARFETLFELQNERRQNELLEEKLSAQRTAMFIGIISMVLLFIAAVLLFRLYRKQRFTTDKLRLQHAELEELYHKLERQKAELSKLNTTKDKLFSVLGHDLRAPITQLHALILILRENKHNELDIDQILNKVEDKLQYSITTLENYLNWAQGQMKGLKTDLKPVHLSEVVNDAIAMMKSNARKKNIDIRNQVDESLYIYADQSLLLITLQNIISNALKFSYSGDAVILDSQVKGDKGIIAVRDDGIGIPDEIKYNLFSSFDESRKGTKNEKGTGLGLSICKEFTEKQGGRIWYNSEEEQGTSFFLEFDTVTEVIEA